MKKVSELDLWAYEEYDDYIEVIFQMVYIVMFASIFPMASIMSWFCNLIEYQSDMFKVTRKLYIR